MKAEHRKELQTNELADWLGRTYENIKTGNRMHLAWAACAVVALGLIGYWVYVFATQPSSSTAALMKLQAAGDNVKDLEKFVEENKSGLPVRTARFELARILYMEGLRDLPSADLRASAIAKLIRSRDLYEQLANECRDMPVLAQEALMWTARAEETLVGAVNPDKAGEVAGSLDKAIGFYQKLAAMTPETFETKAAAARVKVLEDKKTQIEAFYVKLNEQSSKSKK